MDIEYQTPCARDLVEGDGYSANNTIVRIINNDGFGVAGITLRSIDVLQLHNVPAVATNPEQGLHAVRNLLVFGLVGGSNLHHVQHVPRDSIRANEHTFSRS